MPKIIDLIMLISNLLLICLLVLFIKNKLEKSVTKTSLRYMALLSLNERYHFDDTIKSCYIYKEYCKTKAQFDRFNGDKYIIKEVEQNLHFYMNLIACVAKNKKLWIKYQNSVLNLPEPMSKCCEIKSRMPNWLYNKIEIHLINKTILKPVISPLFSIEIYYTSPKGRNSYSRELTYSYEQFIESYKIVNRQIEYKNSKEYQRKLMNDSLRYDIFKRDNFCCVLCGRSVKDGVKLHVDHILPIAKGGKTVPSNLRTLCDRCNIGKSDKYDNQGVN